VTVHGLNDLDSIPIGYKDFPFFFTESIPVPRFTQPPSLCVPATFSQEIKWTESETDYSTPSSAVVKYAQKFYSFVSLHGILVKQE
jgi:hypothetical protein